MATKSVINSNNICVNLIEVNGAFDPGVGLTLIDTIGVVGKTWNGTTFVDTVINYTPDQVVELQTKKALAAFAFMETKLELATTQVPIASANAVCNFGCDRVTQENIIGINVAIAVGIPVPNPTQWTPKGYPFPIAVTHTELAYIGGAILNKKNELYTIYFNHKANILMTSDYDTIAAYDVTTGY